MTRTVQRRVTAPEGQVDRRLPSEIAREEVRGACGWCITRQHETCVNKTTPTTAVDCKCPCRAA